jgi:hypothetical protein
MSAHHAYYLVHGWAGRAELLEQVEAMVRSLGGELPVHEVAAGDRTDPIIEAFEDGRLWLWRVPPAGVPRPSVFPDRPPSRPPPARPVEVLTWIEILLIDEWQGRVANEQVLIIGPDGARHSVRTNDDGLVRVDDLHSGICEVGFPRIDGREWFRKGERPGESGGSAPVVVTRGQHASLLAMRGGLRSLDTLWSHPDNAELRARRDANLLIAGDTVAVPARDDRFDDCATAHRHVFVVRRGQLRLRLRFEQPRGEPWQAGKCDVVIQGAVTTMSRDTKGALAVDVPMGVQQVEVGGLFESNVVLWTGDLEPIDTDRGVRQRLLDLGLVDVEDPPGAQVRAALEEFQCDEGLPVTGEADASTRSRLREVHGC